MYKFLPIAYFEDNFVKFEDAKVSVATHALHYGTAAFGGLRGTVNGNEVFLFRFDRHIKRLSQSAKFLHYKISEELIKSKIIEFIKQNKPATNFYIRPLIYTSSLGISPNLLGVDKNFLIYGIELEDYLSPEGISCRISSWVRQEDQSMPLRGKIAGAYITSSLAKAEAMESGFDEAILTNSQGKICEASAMNIFIVRENKIYTPGVEQDILEGITRASVIDIAKNMGFEVIERPIDKTELFIADEVFFTGTAAKITPVNKIENYILPTSKPVTQNLKTKFTDIVENKSAEYKDWITIIKIS